MIIRILTLVEILTGNNMGLDWNNDNTALLLYKRLENVEGDPKDLIYIPLA